MTSAIWRTHRSCASAAQGPAPSTAAGLKGMGRSRTECADDGGRRGPDKPCFVRGLRRLGPWATGANLRVDSPQFFATAHRIRQWLRVTIASQKNLRNYSLALKIPSPLGNLGNSPRGHSSSPDISHFDVKQLHPVVHQPHGCHCEERSDEAIHLVLTCNDKRYMPDGGHGTNSFSHYM